MNEPAKVPTITDAYRDQRERLVGLARLLTATRHQAEDVVQDVFTEAYGRWDRIEDPSRYLTRAVVNPARDHGRRTRRWQRLARARERVTGIPDVDETWHHLDALPKPQRIVVILRYYGDLGFDDIGAILARPSSTIRSDHRRALQQLRRTLT